MYSEKVKNRLQKVGSLAIRDGKPVIEMLNFCDTVLPEDIDTCLSIPESFSSYHYDPQKFYDLFDADLYTRRAIWTFDPGVACVAALSIAYVSENEYIPTVIFRSSDIKKLDYDLRWVVHVVDNLGIQGNWNKMEVYFLNVHSYI